MESYKIRVVQEKEELDKKIADLESFFIGNIYPTIREEEKDRMQRQKLSMVNYSSILKERILAFK